MMYKNRLALLTIIMGLLLICACAPSTQQSKPIEFSGPTMGTRYHIKLKDLPAKINSGELSTQVDEILISINNTMSTYLDNSELTKLNQNTQSGCIHVSKPLFTVIQKSLIFSEISNGAFDISVGPLVNLWGFGPNFKQQQIPSKSRIKIELKKTGYQNIRLDAKLQCLKKLLPELYLDLSAIAKGYAVDQIAAHFDSIGLENYMIEIGGEIRTHSNHPDVQWRIAIEEPNSQAQKLIRDTINLSSIAIATSGNYRNFFILDGKHYSHTINPQNGWPVEHGLASVTVLHPSAMEADAYATLLTVLGPQKAPAFAERHQLCVYFIVKENGLYKSLSSSKFKQCLAKQN